MLLEDYMIVNCLNCGKNYWDGEAKRMKYCSECGAPLDPNDYKLSEAKREKAKSNICDYYCKYADNYDEPCIHCPLDNL